MAERLPDEVELVPIQTSSSTADKSRFVKEIEEALLAGDVDLAVHSAKDVPGDLPEGLTIVGVPEREDPLDALCGAASLDELPSGAAVGTASLRRRAQLAALRPDLEVRELRGNVDTRLGRFAAGDYDAIVLATAGLARLGRAGEIAFRFGLDQLTPAPGQGCLALEAAAGDERSATAAATISDRAALAELAAERAAVRALGASCDTPVGVCARFDERALVVIGYAGSPDGDAWVRDRVEGDPEQPAALGEALAERMLAAGAGEILAAAAEAAR